jgi:hypothetical protein
MSDVNSIKMFASYVLLVKNLYYLPSGPPCPKGMTSLVGRCMGVVLNSISNTSSDSNCNWKSGDLNYKMATFANDKVSRKICHLNSSTCSYRFNFVFLLFCFQLYFLDAIIKMNYGHFSRSFNLIVFVLFYLSDIFRCRSRILDQK